ncbi:LegC family aminotransferase [Leeuwenhoekiella aequorea]|mgnify:CR=1 FL=1|uniref:LegC family aminotransferase n=1 Tax=Leeuwenhoekiella aequorea TaxID=283736 RepID=UPI00352F8A1B|tara:strand:- start:14686 stop:15831 length:1146 start_codon:yes stop_codon:yes gene_type:complete
MRVFQETINFVREVYKTTSFIPLHEPTFKGNERNYVLDAIDSTFVSSVGEYVDRFECMMSSFTKTRKAVAVVNGTSGIQVALKLLGVKTGDEVLTQSLTFVATANAIAYNGARPVFLDVDLDTMGLSPIALENFLSEFGQMRGIHCFNKKTGNRIAACLPMHTFGFPMRIDKVVEICKQWGIPVIEDAAESLGSSLYDKATGSFGDIGVFSFNGNKIITSGGGGALVTNDVGLAQRAKYITTTAKKPHQYEYFHNELGFNFRMPNINAALACAQLERIDLFLTKKRQLAETYLNFFDSHSLNFRTGISGTKVNFWLMCLELKNREERDEFLNETNSAGVMTRPIWELMFRLPMYQDCLRDDQKNAIYLADRIVNIPSSVKE